MRSMDMTVRLAGATAGITVLLLIGGCINPFAPGRDNSPATSACDPHTVEGVFQCFTASYSYRDTLIYGSLIDGNFIFRYPDYNAQIEVTWGRDEEMRSTYGLFQNAQRLDLIWNAISSMSTDSMTVTLVRGFNLTIMFNPGDIERIDGAAHLTLRRNSPTDAWKIVEWRDESNY
jgi:hypothetical protein